MTETEAYKVVGWAPEGGAPNPFVLPLSNSDSADWIASQCLRCGGRGVTLVEAVEKVCPLCGSGLVMYYFNPEDRA